MSNDDLNDIFLSDDEIKAFSREMNQPIKKDVSAQAHYTGLKIQPILVMLNDLSPDQFMGYLKGNVLKYILRADGKNHGEDYAKAVVYATWAEEYARTGTITVKDGKQ